jgi:hypothetical protein
VAESLEEKRIQELVESSQSVVNKKISKPNNFDEGKDGEDDEVLSLVMLQHSLN